MRFIHPKIPDMVRFVIDKAKSGVVYTGLTLINERSNYVLYGYSHVINNLGSTPTTTISLAASSSMLSTTKATY